MLNIRKIKRWIHLIKTRNPCPHCKDGILWTPLSSGGGSTGEHCPYCYGTGIIPPVAEESLSAGYVLGDGFWREHMSKHDYDECMMYYGFISLSNGEKIPSNMYGKKW